ncbi:MAG: ATP-binding protein [Alphaproteobacteria bacterium]|jgi:two-component system cell cycle sensor histidine kinase/response regulator CckA|nr:ATP-binding protein [Candidatus Jidaibacter sp.]
MFKYFKFRAAKYLFLILAVFLISFLSSLAILTWDTTDSLAVFISYLTSFGTAFVVNIFLMRRWLHHEQNYVDKITLFTEVLSKENALVAIIDSNLNILNQLTSNTDFYSDNYSNIEPFFNQIGIAENISSPIKHFIKGKYKDLYTEDLEREILYFNNTMIIPNVRLIMHNYSIVVIKLEGSSNLYCITFRKEFKNSNDSALNSLPIAYFELDEGGQITKINSQFETMLGYFSNDVNKLNLSLSSLITQYFDNEPVDVSKRPFQGFVTLKPKEGQQLRFFLYTFFAVNEKTISGFIVNVDSNNYLENLASLKENWFEFSWKCFFEHSPYPVCYIDKNGIILKTNPAFFKQLEELGFSGKNFASFFDDAFKKKFQSNIYKNLNAVEHSHMSEEFLDVKLKNSSKVFDIWTTKVIDLKNNFCGYMLRLSDVTAQKQLEDSFSHAQRMQTIGHLVGSVAHDFNNILTAISGFCDLLMLRHGVSDPSFSNIMQIKQSADRASGLVKRLLAFSRKQTLLLNSLSPIDLFSEFTPLIQRLIGSKIKLSLKIDPNIWNILVDSVQMEQVLLNLVVNAQHAMTSEGELTIKVDNFIYEKPEQLKSYFSPINEKLPDFGEYVKIIVKDTGVGIPEENLLKIFEPFFTTKNDKTTTGTGLGLSTVYGIVRQSNAYIFVKSVIGKGTTFMLLFKKTEPEPTKIEHLQKEPSESSDLSGNAVIALVEDEDAIRIFAKKILTNKGYYVLDFPSAKIAYNALKEKIDTIDLVITDVIMPEMTGPSMVTKLHQIKPNLKVIFISGYAEEAFTEEYGDKRDFHFIPKPFSLKQLLSKVKEVSSS